MTRKIFVDGQEGTTGLKIHERLQGRSDITMLEIDPEKRKDAGERKKLINESDITFLCLPDDAAKEAVSLVENSKTRLIDASTAHRTNDSWAYGFPELSPEHREKIRKSARVSVPGCYASGFAALMYPLVKEGIVPADYPVACHAVSGYSGGGKSRIAEYNAASPSDESMKSPRFYALDLKHKHIPEMRKTCGLLNTPIFTPIIGPYYNGMIVAVPLHTRFLPSKCDAASICEFLTRYYEGERFVKVVPYGSAQGIKAGFFDATGCNGTNMLEIYVTGNDEHVLLMSRLDNLGKGASGAAVQCMNIMLGFDETSGLL